MILIAKVIYKIDERRENRYYPIEFNWFFQWTAEWTQRNNHIHGDCVSVAQNQYYVHKCFYYASLFLLLFLSLSQSHESGTHRIIGNGIGCGRNGHYFDWMDNVFSMQLYNLIETIRILSPLCYCFFSDAFAIICKWDWLQGNWFDVSHVLNWIKKNRNETTIQLHLIAMPSATQTHGLSKQVHLVGNCVTFT